MAMKKRPGSARRTLAQEAAARKPGAPGKRFVGEAADQSEKARRHERRKVARVARSAARKARPDAAARTSGPARGRRGGEAAPAAPPPERKAAGAEAAFRAAEEDAAVHGAEVEPAGRAEGARVDDLGDAAIRRADAAAARATAERWDGVPSEDVSDDYRERTAPSVAGALSDLARGALRLAAAVATAPLRVALALPRMALTALRLA